MKRALVIAALVAGAAGRAGADSDVRCQRGVVSFLGGSASAGATLLGDRVNAAATRAGLALGMDGNEQVTIAITVAQNTRQVSTVGSTKLYRSNVEIEAELTTWFGARLPLAKRSYASTNLPFDHAVDEAWGNARGGANGFVQELETKLASQLGSLAHGVKVASVPGGAKIELVWPSVVAGRSAGLTDTLIGCLPASYEISAALTLGSATVETPRLAAKAVPDHPALAIPSSSPVDASVTPPRPPDAGAGTSGGSVGGAPWYEKIGTLAWTLLGSLGGLGVLIGLYFKWGDRRPYLRVRKVTAKWTDGEPRRLTSLRVEIHSRTKSAATANRIQVRLFLEDVPIGDTTIDALAADDAIEISADPSLLSAAQEKSPPSPSSPSKASIQIHARYFRWFRVRRREPLSLGDRPTA